MDEADGLHIMTLRLPSSLVKRLKTIAKDDKRSLRATVEAILEEYVKRRETRSDTKAEG